jgi:hypothetical protein
VTEPHDFSGGRRDSRKSYATLAPAERAMRVLALAIALLAPAGPAPAAGPAANQSREVTGQAGVLGEWELTATVTLRADGGMQQFVGPLTIRHVGVCTTEGPEEKTGELRLRISESAARVRATLLIDATECAYSGDLKDGYQGVMSCPDRRAVPLTLWIK